MRFREKPSALFLSLICVCILIATQLSLAQRFEGNGKGFLEDFQ